MTCQETRQKLTSYLEDLLQENEYQEVREHLSECSKCKSYADATGSLSYKIWELGEVPVPEDLLSTILFRLKHPEPGKVARTEIDHPPQAKAKANPVLIGTLLILGASTFFFAGMHLKSATSLGRQSSETSPPNINMGRSAISPLETTTEMIKTILYGMKGASSDEKIAKLESMLAESNKRPTSLKDWRPVHWHYHVSSSSQAELLQLIRDQGLTIDYESSKFLLLYVPKSKLGAFDRGMSGLSGITTEFNKSEIKNVTDESVQVSVFMIDK